MGREGGCRWHSLCMNFFPETPKFAHRRDRQQPKPNIADLTAAAALVAPLASSSGQASVLAYIEQAVRRWPGISSRQSPPKKREHTYTSCVHTHPNDRRCHAWPNARRSVVEGATGLLVPSTNSRPVAGRSDNSLASSWCGEVPVQRPHFAPSSRRVAWGILAKRNRVGKDTLDSMSRVVF
jgi:hypothetical protein